MARKSKVAGSIMRIQDEIEKLEIAKFSSDELVKKISNNEVVGVRHLLNGKVRIYFIGLETTQIMDKRREWASKLLATAPVASLIYQILVHEIPLSINPDNPEKTRELERQI